MSDCDFCIVRWECEVSRQSDQCLLNRRVLHPDSSILDDSAGGSLDSVGSADLDPDDG